MQSKFPLYLESYIPVSYTHLQVQVSDVKFQRDADFQVSEHIGKKGLIRNEVYELDVLIHGESALLVSEKMIGIDPKGEWIDEHVLHFTTIMEGKIPAMQFLLSLGNQVEEMCIRDRCTIYRL